MYPKGNFEKGQFSYLHKEASVGVLELSASPRGGWHRRELLVLANTDNVAAGECNYNVCPVAPVVLATGYTGERECICDESVGHINCAGSQSSIAGNHTGFCAPSQPRADTLAADSCRTLPASSCSCDAANFVSNIDSRKHRVFTDAGCSVQAGMFSCAFLGGPDSPECIPGDDEFKNEAAFQSSSSTAPVPAPKKVIQYTKGGLQTSSTKSFTIGVPVQLKKSMAAMAAAEAVATQRCAIEPGVAVAESLTAPSRVGGQRGVAGSQDGATTECRRQY